MIGGARDGFFGGHVIGPVSGALLHRSPIPVALAPRGYAEDPRPGHRRGHGGRAHPAGAGQSVAVCDHARQRGTAAHPHGVAFVGGEPVRGRRYRSAAPDTAGRIRGASARSLHAHCPTPPRSSRLVADGLTLESALKKLNWEQSDLLVVGSSRFAVTATGVPRFDRRAHPGRHRRPGRGDPPHRGLASREFE